MSEAPQLNFRFQSDRLARALGRIGKLVAGAGGRTLVVGGSVRDAALGLTSVDLDLEVYGVAPRELEQLLRGHFKLDRVGKAFGVLKLKGLPIDVALPRRESKAGLGHRSFEVLSDPWMTTQEAQSRRDFTINAMAWDPLSQELIDHFGGWEDLQARRLRHTSPKFAEDPLRVMRGAQFVARFDLTVAAETIELCRTIEPEGLAAERLYEEWKKLLLAGATPSRGLEFLRQCGWIQYFPELAVLVGCRQPEKWHPEGDVWTHTLQSIDAFARERIGDSWEDLVVGFAVLCHDFGKPATTHEEGGTIRSHGHEQAGEEPTRSFLQRLTHQSDLVDQVLPLVLHHGRPRHLHDAAASDAAVRRLAQRVDRIDRLVRVARADTLGRSGGRDSDDTFPAGTWLLERAQALRVDRQAPQPLVLGRHLIELGLKPGPHFKPLLDACLEGQINGDFDSLEGGKHYLVELVRQRSQSDS
jgi:tRNA nucleotidyltransferase (CCA-adding enzyme)